MPRALARGADAPRERKRKSGKTRQVYLLYGDEFFLKEEAVAEIREAFLGEVSAGELSWSQTVLEGGTASLAEILDAARTLPMLSPRRVVLVKDAEKIREADADSLRNYLKSPSPTTCLVFITGAGKPDFRKAVFRALKEKGAAVEFRVLKEDSVEEWIRERARKRKAEIDPEALALLKAHLGSELFRIDQALVNVLEFLSPSRKITAQALGEVLGGATAGSVFELAENVGAGEEAEAMRLLREILADGEEPVRLLSLIARQVRILILGKSLERKGHRGRDLALALGVPPYPAILDKVQRLISVFPETAGPPCLRRILEADRAIKLGTGKGPAVLERLVLDITSLVKRPGGRQGTRP